jgi:hypothetical protein
VQIRLFLEIAASQGNQMNEWTCQTI